MTGSPRNVQSGPTGPEENRVLPEDSAGLVSALKGLDANRARALTNRTRRAVHEAAANLQEGRHLSRRSTGIALLTLVGLVVLLSPAIWNSVDDMLGGDFLLDTPGIVAAMAFTLFAAVAAVLFLVGGQSRRGLRQSRR
jgi:hypothetical protein